MAEESVHLKECPSCRKSIPGGITLCPYCKKDEKGQELPAAASSDSDAQLQADLRPFASEDPVTRQQALERIAQRGPSTVPGLLRVLTEHTLKGLPEIAKLLGRLRDPRAIPALLQAMKLGDEELRVAAVHALSVFRDPMIFHEFLLEAERPNPLVQGFVAHMLGQMQDPRALPVLTKLAKHPAEEVSFQAICAIGEIGDPSGILVLRQMLRRKEAILREAAAGSLRHLGGPVRRLIPAAYYFYGFAASSVLTAGCFFWMRYR